MDLSQRELAAEGVSYAYISRIEAGTRSPSVKALRMLAPKLGVSVDYLETGTQGPLERLKEIVGRYQFELERYAFHLDVFAEVIGPKADHVLPPLIEIRDRLAESTAALRELVPKEEDDGEASVPKG